MSRLGRDIKAGVKGLHGVGETIRGTFNEAADQIFDSKQKRPHTQSSQLNNRAIIEKGKAEIDGADEMIARYEAKRKGGRLPVATNVDTQHAGEYSRPTEGYTPGTTGSAIGNTSSATSNVHAKPTEGYTQPTEGYAPAPAGSTTGMTSSAARNMETRPAEAYGQHTERYNATATGHAAGNGSAALSDFHLRPTEGYAQPTGGYTPATSRPATRNTSTAVPNADIHEPPAEGYYASAPTESTGGLGGTVPSATSTFDHAQTGPQQGYHHTRM
jgi:hypothetical protein